MNKDEASRLANRIQIISNSSFDELFSTFLFLKSNNSYGVIAYCKSDFREWNNYELISDARIKAWFNDWKDEFYE